MQNILKMADRQEWYTQEHKVGIARSGPMWSVHTHMMVAFEQSEWLGKSYMIEDCPH